MALSATILKATLNIADISRHYYQELNLTIAQHPSETTERVMVRLLAYALHAQTQLQFTKGLSNDDEPDIWLKSLSGDIELWIDVGSIDAKRIGKACGRAAEVVIYCYGGHSTELWWQQNAQKLARYNNLTVIDLNRDNTRALAHMAQRNMELQCTIDDGQICLSDATQSIYVEYQVLCSSNTK